ncbi:MAG: maleylpyruvate isomerase family mycothiol-dependent enzyme [Kineosporiaceae bacterium]
MPQPTTDQLKAVLVAERHAVADLALTLDDAQLATPSLCGAWTVKDVVAHLAFAVHIDWRAFARSMARHRGDFDAVNDELARSWGRRPVAELAHELRGHAAGRLSNPGQGVAGPLTDALVHGADIRLPLGLVHDADPDVAAACLRFVVSGRAFGFVPRGRTSGLSFIAEDAADGDGLAFGGGAIVRGRALDLLLAVLGRRVTLDSLSGAGAAELARRLS